MKNTRVIAWKEFRTYLASPTAYIVTSIYLIFTGVFFANSPTTILQTSISGFLQVAGVMTLLLSAVLTMRLLAEERKMGTLELLLTVPVRDSEVIMGKFLGSLAILLVMLALTLYYPLLLIIFGDPDPGPVIAGYLGLVLIGSASLAVGIFASSLTSNQIVAAVVSAGILFGLWFLGIAASYMPENIGTVVNYLSMSFYFPDFIRGIIDTRGLVYYLSIAVLFIFLAVRSLENSRWS